MFAIALLKISILLQYLRIFNFRIFAYTLIAFSAGFGAAFITATLASCKPFNYWFQRWKIEYRGECIDFYRQHYASSVINIILDGTITLAPATQMQVEIAQVTITKYLNVLITRHVVVSNFK